MTCPKCNQELSRYAFYRHKNVAVCAGDDNRSVDTVPIIRNEMQHSSACSQEHTIGSEGCDMSDGEDSGPEFGPESTAASTDSDSDEVEVITNQEDASDVGQQGTTEQVDDSGSGQTDQYNIPMLKRIVQAMVVLIFFSVEISYSRERNGNASCPSTWSTKRHCKSCSIHCFHTMVKRPFSSFTLSPTQAVRYLKSKAQGICCLPEMPQNV